MNEGQEWGCDCIDERAITGAVDVSPKFQDGWQPKQKSLLKNFLKLLPWDFFVDVIISNTSLALTEEKMPVLTEGEFLRYIGLWLLMSTVSGFPRNSYWSKLDFDEKKNPRPYNFPLWMSKHRFDNIT